MPVRQYRIKQYDFFGQDEWRVRRDLVINYGLRWEINMAPPSTQTIIQTGESARVVQLGLKLDF